jgi:hypothetical protein
VRRAKFLHAGDALPDQVRGQRWLLLISYGLDAGKRQEPSTLFALNRRMLTDYVLKQNRL